MAVGWVFITSLITALLLVGKSLEHTNPAALAHETHTQSDAVIVRGAEGIQTNNSTFLTFLQATF